MIRAGKKNISLALRAKILDIAAQTEKAHVHIGSCMSCTDILIETLVFQMKPVDKFILSKGHASLALFVVLNYLKKISSKKLSTYFAEGTHYGIHTPSSLPKHIPLATGSLGHGLSFASGLALGYQFLDKKNPRKVFCLMSDGECNEGAVWEAAQFASHHKLYNLTVMVDKNGLQALGRTKDVLGDGASVSKWSAFGFNTVTCNGHSYDSLTQGFKKLSRFKNKKPGMLICKTVRGYGIRDVENKVVSNYTAVNREIADKATARLQNL